MHCLLTITNTKLDGLAFAVFTLQEIVVLAQTIRLHQTKKVTKKTNTITTNHLSTKTHKQHQTDKALNGHILSFIE